LIGFVVQMLRIAAPLHLRDDVIGDFTGGANMATRQEVMRRGFTEKTNAELSWAVFG